MKRFKDTTKPLTGGANPGSFAEGENPPPAVTSVADRKHSPDAFSLVGVPAGAVISDRAWDYRNLSEQTLVGLQWNATSALEVVLVGATIEESDLSGVDLRDAKARHATITDTKMTYADLRGANFQHAEFTRCDFNNAKFAKTAAKARFDDCIMYGTYVNGTNLRDTDFTKCHLNSAEFDGVNLIGAEFEDTDLQWVKFTSGSVLRDTRFSNCAMRRLEFTSVDAEGLDIARSDATDTMFTATDLTDATFIGSDLRGSHFQNTVINGARFDASDLSNTSWSGVEFRDPDQFARAASVRGARFALTDTPDHQALAVNLRRDGAEVTFV